MAPVKTVHRQGRTEFDALAYQDYTTRHVIPYTDLVANVIRLPIQKDKHVLGVRVRTSKAFTTSGAAVTVKIGDSANDDGYLVTTDLDVTTLNTVIDSRRAGPEDGTSGVTTFNAFALGGKYYAAPDYLLVTFAGTLTAGQLVVEILYSGYEAAARDELVNQ